MASQLNGRIKQMAWGDYTKDRRSGPKQAGQPFAYTHTNASKSAVTFSRVPGSQPAAFRVNDNVTVTASFVDSSSWMMLWILSEPQTIQDQMLKHEQGHYDITALIARDFFVDVMLLKQLTFPSEGAGNTRVQQIVNGSLRKAQAVHTLYDQEVHPEHLNNNYNGTKQQEWDTLIQNAFSQARVPASQSVDGKSHKVRLIDLVRASGRTIP